jgi:hypothetical protein
MRRTAALPSLVSSALAACALFTLSACGLLLDTSPPDPPPGAPDGATPDADATTDAGPIDAGPIDAGPIDAGFDAGPIDAGFDAGPIDAGFDAGPIDAGFDAGPCVDRDEDGDGISACDGDCDDANPLVNPGTMELCDDGLDNDCDASTPDACSERRAVYVSQRVGADTNPGTRDRPVASITRGIAIARDLGVPQSVIVGGGLYVEDVTLVDRVSLRGGFRCASDALCDWAFDPIAAESTIQNIDSDGIVADATVREETVVEDFRILGWEPSATEREEIAGFTLLGGAPTIRDNVIEVGLAGTTAGLRPRVVGVSIPSTAGGGTAQILDNEIRTGAAVILSAAIRMNSAAGERTRARIEGNVLQPGEAQRSVGLVAFNSDDGTEVVDNDFLVGSSRMGVIHGIEVASTMRIARNRIHVPPPGGTPAPSGCSTSDAWCTGIAIVIASASATLVLENNVIFGPPGPRSTALLLGEFERTAGSVFVANNLLDGGGGIPFGTPGGGGDKSAAVVFTNGPCATCTPGESVFASLQNNILLGGRATERFGVYEDPVVSGGVARDVFPGLLAHNVFFFRPATALMAPPGVLYRRVRGASVMSIYDIAMVNALTSPVSFANQLVDPQLDPTFHLLPRSTCIDTGLSDRAPLDDFDGEARPRGAGFDIGPDEY